MGLIIEIPQFTGKLEVPLNTAHFHIGKQEFKNSIAVLPKDEKAFEPISSVRKDNAGIVIKEQFIIHYANGQYTIEDRGSTNGTYIGSMNLKGQPPAKVHSGMEIIVPIQENNQLVQMILILKIVPDTQISSNNQPVYHSPQYSTPNVNGGANSGGSAAQYHQPVYNTPPSKGNAGVSAPAGAAAIPIPGGYQPGPAQYNDPTSYSQNLSQSQMGLDSNQSFIVRSQIVSIPTNPFVADSGIDLSFVYKLEKSEAWHILIALLLLMAMIFRTTLNILIIQLIIKEVAVDEIGEQLLMYLPIIFIFPLSFLIHELAHLNMGKHFKYPSRFCLTIVGLATTKKAIIIGLPFGLPGAAVSVGVDPDHDQRQMGFIKMAGPASNLTIGILLTIIAWVIPLNGQTSFLFKTGILQGASLNCVLGLFNMVPIAIRGFALDGQYILKWNKPLYIFMVITLIIMMILIFTSLNTFQLDFIRWKYDSFMSQS